jgi:hypothetical protein
VVESDVRDEQRFDFAFVTVHPYRDTRTPNVEDAAGGVPIEINQSTDNSWTAYGYPKKQSVPDITAGTLTVYFDKCSGTSTLSDPSSVPGTTGPLPLQMSCNLHLGNGGSAEGASGGPWFNNNTNTLGAINKGYGNSFLLGIYLSDQAEIDFLKASLP